MTTTTTNKETTMGNSKRDITPRIIVDWTSPKNGEGLSRSKLDQTCDVFDSYSQEPGKIQQVKGTLYYYASELGCLRLWHQYNRAVRNEKTRVSKSENNGKWFFSLDL